MKKKQKKPNKLVARSRARLNQQPVSVRECLLYIIYGNHVPVVPFEVLHHMEVNHRELIDNNYRLARFFQNPIKARDAY